VCWVCVHSLRTAAKLIFSDKKITSDRSPTQEAKSVFAPVGRLAQAYAPVRAHKKKERSENEARKNYTQGTVKDVGCIWNRDAGGQRRLGNDRVRSAKTRAAGSWQMATLGFPSAEGEHLSARFVAARWQRRFELAGTARGPQSEVAIVDLARRELDRSAGDRNESGIQPRSSCGTGSYRVIEWQPAGLLVAASFPGTIDERNCGVHGHFE
jgi:hypothetical protein